MAKVSRVALAFCLAIAATSPHASAFAPPTSRGVAFVSVQTSNGIHSVEPSAVILGMSSEATASSGGIKSILTKLPDSQVELTIPVPGEVTKLAYEKAAFEVGKELTIPGFRKGARIPASIVESTLRKAGNINGLRGEAVKNLMKQLVETAIKEEHGLDPIGAATPIISIEELAKDFQPGEPLDLKVKCDVWPDVSWKENADAEKPYFGLTGSYTRKPFNQQKFDAAIKDLCDRYATLAPMEEGATLAMGDACVVNMVGFMAAEDGVTKADPLPNAASGDDVEVILGPGRYMEGLVEGLVGAKVGDTRTVTVSFPEKLRDKTLAGKKAIFDVTVNTASHRSTPEVTDEFAEKVRPGMTAVDLEKELRKAIDDEDAKEFVNERNEALSKALADRIDVDVPDTLVTNSAREKYALMMTDMRDNGMADDEIKNLITPENFVKYKKVVKGDICKDFRVSMACDEVARLEGIEVQPSMVDEQMTALKKEAEGQEDFDENQIRGKVESTLQRRLVFDFLAEKANLEVIYAEEQKFDEGLLEKLAEESLEREQAAAALETEA